MFDTPRSFYRGTIGTTTNALLVTVPNGVIWVLRNVVIAAGSNSPAVTLQINGTNLLSAVPVTANTVFTLDCMQVFAAGQPINGWADVSGATIHMAGIEVAL